MLVLFCNFITKYKNNDYKLLVAFKAYLFKISDNSRIFFFWRPNANKSC